MYRAANAKDDLKKATGAYIILYQNGEHYIGKGGFKRAIKSATEHMTDDNKVASIIWAPTSSEKSAFVTEYLLQSVYGIGKKVTENFNKIWSPGKRLFQILQ